MSRYVDADEFKAILDNCCNDCHDHNIGSEDHDAEACISCGILYALGILDDMPTICLEETGLEPKTCPHCGGTSCLHSNYSTWTHKYFVYVKCDICGAQGKSFCCHRAPSEDNWKNNACYDAIRAWNRRV